MAAALPTIGAAPLEAPNCSSGLMTALPITGVALCLAIYSAMHGVFASLKLLRCVCRWRCLQLWRSRSLQDPHRGFWDDWTPPDGRSLSRLTEQVREQAIMPVKQLDVAVSVNFSWAAAMSATGRRVPLEASTWSSWSPKRKSTIKN
jgi:hypothetical protein